MLLKNTDALKRASGSLARAHQVSANTDQIAVGVMEDLDDQKASLIRTRNRVSLAMKHNTHNGNLRAP